MIFLSTIKINLSFKQLLINILFYILLKLKFFTEKVIKTFFVFAINIAIIPIYF